jgi:hypothetical protein
LHLGYTNASYAKGLMAGCDQELSKGTYLLLDRLSGTESYLAVGVYRELTKRFALTFTYGFANSREVENYSGLNLCYTVPLSIGNIALTD